MTMRSWVQWLVLAVLVCASASCASRPYVPAEPIEVTFYEKRVDALAKKLDPVGRYLDEWGTLSIGGSLYDATGEDYAFDLKVTPDDLYKASRTEGRSRSAQVFALLASAAIEAKLDKMPAAMGDDEMPEEPAEDTPQEEEDSQAGDAGGGGAPTTASDTETDTKDEEPEESEDESEKKTDADGQDPVSPTRPTTNAALDKVGDFSPVQKLAEGPVEMNLRRRLRLTASDWAELGGHKFLLNATKRKLAGKYRIVYLPFTVSCQPGWRTSAGYAGRIDASVMYTFGGKPLTDDLFQSAHPMVVGVYPAVDSQELNLRHSAREMYALALSLKVIGLDVGADALKELATRQESDSETQTGLSVMTSYTNGGRNFGFEFRPSFQALVDPGKTKSKAGFELQATSIPALAIVAVYEPDLQARPVFVMRSIVEELGDPEKRRAIMGLSSMAELSYKSGAEELRPSDDEITLTADVLHAVGEQIYENRWRVSKVWNEMDKHEHLDADAYRKKLAKITKEELTTIFKGLEFAKQMETGQAKVQFESCSDARATALSNFWWGVLRREMEVRESVGPGLQLTISHSWSPLEEPGKWSPGRKPLVTAPESYHSKLSGLARQVISEGQALKGQLTELLEIRRDQLDEGGYLDGVLDQHMKKMARYDVGKWDSGPSGRAEQRRKYVKELRGWEDHARAATFISYGRTVQSRLGELTERSRYLLAQLDNPDPRITLGEDFFTKPEAKKPKRAISGVTPSFVVAGEKAVLAIDGTRLRTVSDDEKLMRWDVHLYAGPSRISSLAMEVIGFSDDRLLVGLTVPPSMTGSIGISIGDRSKPGALMTSPIPVISADDAKKRQLASGKPGRETVRVSRGGAGSFEVNVPAGKDDVGFKRILDLLQVMPQGSEDTDVPSEAIVKASLTLLGQSAASLGRAKASLTSAQAALVKAAATGQVEVEVQSARAATAGAVAAIVETEKGIADLRTKITALEKAAKERDVTQMLTLQIELEALLAGAHGLAALAVESAKTASSRVGAAAEAANKLKAAAAGENEAPEAKAAREKSNEAIKNVKLHMLDAAGSVDACKAAVEAAKASLPAAKSAS
ncbi:MAG: hypothetical protein AAFX05_05765 [Planctomycetota bacterium]